MCDSIVVLKFVIWVLNLFPFDVKEMLSVAVVTWLQRKSMECTDKALSGAVSALKSAAEAHGIVHNDQPHCTETYWDLQTCCDLLSPTETYRVPLRTAQRSRDCLDWTDPRQWGSANTQSWWGHIYQQYNYQKLMAFPTFIEFEVLCAWSASEVSQ